MARRSEHSRDEIREMALAAAEALIEAEGLAGISARKVAAEIGYTVGSLYMVFENFDDLLLQVSARTLDQLYLQLTQATQRCRTPQSCIKALGHTYVQYAVANPRRWSAVFEHRLPEGRPSPEWYEKRVERMFALVEQPAALLHKNRQAVTAAARVLWCGVHGICMLHMNSKLRQEDQAHLQSLIDNLIENYLAGWTAKG